MSPESDRTRGPTAGPRPLVSVIVPAYNRPGRTQRAVDSVARQTYRPMELIVVDDGSSPPLETDLTLRAEAFRRARLLRHNENRGANVARITGLEAAAGEYLAFLDSDDEWLPEKIDRQVAGLQANRRAEASYTGFRLVDEEGRLNSVRRAVDDGRILEPLLSLDAAPNNSVAMVSRAAVEAVGPPSAELPAWQDWEWYLRLAAQVQFDAVACPLAIKHAGTGQVGRSYRSKREEAYPIMKEVIRSLPVSCRQVKIGLAYLDFRLGYTALVTGRYGEARRSFLAAIRGHPLEPPFYFYLACAGPHYPWLRDLKRAGVRLLGSE